MSAYRAPRRGEERHRVPAGRAQRVRFIDRDAACQTARRQHAIDNGAPDPMHGPMQMRGQGCRKLHRFPLSGMILRHHPGERARVNRGMRRWRSIRAIMSSSEPSPTALFDRRAWRAHRNRAAAGAVDFLHDEIGERLLDRLDLVNREFADVLDLGARDGGLAAPARDSGRARRGSSWPNRRPDFSHPGERRSASRPIPSWCRFATPASISSSAIWCCTGRPICPACWCSCAARCGRTGCCWRRCSAGRR